MGIYNELLSLKVNVISIQTVIFSGHAILLEHQQVL